MRPYAPIARPSFMVFEGGGADVSGTNTTERDGRLTLVGWTGERRGPRVEAIGGKTVARNTIKTITEKEDTMTMRHAAPRSTNAVTRRPLKRSSEIILATIIYLTASCFAIVGTLGVAAAIWVLWGALGVR